MAIQRALVLVAILLVLGATPTMATHVGGTDLLHEAQKCSADGSGCDLSAAAPAVDPSDALASAVAAPPRPGLAARLGALLAGGASFASDAARDAYDAALAAALGAAAAVVGLLRAYAAFLLGLQPAGLPDPAFAALATAGTAAAAAGAQLSLWWLARRLAPWLTLVPGFSRIARDELLEHGRRAALYDMIQQNPGIRLTELSRGLGLAWGTCLHHLRKLRADRLITIQQLGRFKCYFVNGSGLSPDAMRAAVVVHGKTLQGVAAYIREHPQTSLQDLARALGISSPLAAFHVSKLERAGLVLKRRQGRKVRLAIAAPLATPELAADGLYPPPQAPAPFGTPA